VRSHISGTSPCRPDRSAEGLMPNIALKVREKCARSAKPEAWAASVSEVSNTANSITFRSRTHRTYRRIGMPTCCLNRCCIRLSDNPTRLARLLPKKGRSGRSCRTLRRSEILGSNAFRGEKWPRKS